MWETTGFFETTDPADPGIDATQNVKEKLLLDEIVSLSGSEWSRSVVQTLALEQTFSDFIAVEVQSNLGLSSVVSPALNIVSSIDSTLSLSQGLTVAGGRILVVGGGSGDTVNTFDITFSGSSPNGFKGQIVYIDNIGEAQLAAADGVAEAVGFLTEDVLSGQATKIQTEGELVKTNWVQVTGSANLVPGAIYFLHNGGQMRPEAPNTGTITIVGRAVTTTRFDIEINPPWE